MMSTYLKSDRNLTPEAAEALDQLVKATYERMRKSGLGRQCVRGFKREAKSYRA